MIKPRSPLFSFSRQRGPSAAVRRFFRAATHCERRPRWQSSLVNPFSFALLHCDVAWRVGGCCCVHMDGNISNIAGRTFFPYLTILKSSKANSFIFVTFRTFCPSTSLHKCEPAHSLTPMTLHHQHHLPSAAPSEIQFGIIPIRHSLSHNDKVAGNAA